MSRQLFLVCYDISDDSRLRKVREFLTAWRVQGQKSAMECWFTPSELVFARAQLAQLIDDSEDVLHIIRLDPRQAVLHIGKDSPFDDRIRSFFIH